MLPPDAEPLLLADGFESALVGWCVLDGERYVAIYDREKCIKILMKRDRMTQEDAREFFEFNVEGSYMGPQTPIFMYACSYHVFSAA